MRRADLYSAAVFFVFAIVMIVLVIPAQTTEGNAYGLPPAFLPTLAASAIGLLSAVLFVQKLLAAREEPVRLMTMPQARTLLAAVAVLACGVAGLRYAGTWVGGSILIAGTMIILGTRKPLPIVLTILVVIGFIQILVGHILHSELP